MKKLYVILSFILLTILITGTLFVNAGAVKNSDLCSVDKANFLGVNSNNPIKLVSAFTSDNWYYHGIYDTTRKFTALVENLAYEKKVVVYHEKKDSSWVELPMTFKESVADNKEVWVLNHTVREEDLGENFTLMYVVNGKTYWDNNKGKDYKMGSNEGTYLQEFLNLSSLQAYFNAYDEYNMDIYTSARNIAYAKDIKIHYTLDDWKTVSVTSAKFMPYYSTGSGTYITSPNKNNIEIWHARANFQTNCRENVKYVISYKVNDIEYFDNNFGKGYTFK